MRRNESIAELSHWIGCSPDGDPDQMQSKLKCSLKPMVQLALRTGLGAPAFVDWVTDARRQLAGHTETVDASRCADTIASWLAHELLHDRNDSTTRAVRDRTQR